MFPDYIVEKEKKPSFVLFDSGNTEPIVAQLVTMLPTLLHGMR